MEQPKLKYHTDTHCQMGAGIIELGNKIIMTLRKTISEYILQHSK